MAIAGDGGERGEGPACVPTRFGLRSVADVSVDGTAGWTKGLEWDELACGYDPGIVSGQCPTLPEQRKTAVRGYGTNYADAFAVYAGWECSTGGLTLSEAWDNAEELLERNWWRTLERAFWLGVDQDDNPIRTTLASSEVTDLTPFDGALEISSGVAKLESFAGDCFDCEPIIHANRGIGTYLQERGLLLREDGMQTLAATGTRVALGGGYPISGPSPTESGESGAEELADGEAWLYVTGSVKITHSNTFFTPPKNDLAGAVDREVNDITIFAERFAAFQLGCCVGAVRVNLTGCCCG